MSKHRIFRTLSLEERKESSSRKATCECLLQTAFSLPDAKPETPHFSFFRERIQHTTGISIKVLQKVMKEPMRRRDLA